MCVGLEGRRKERDGYVALMWKNILVSGKYVKRLGSDKVEGQTVIFKNCIKML